MAFVTPLNIQFSPAQTLSTKCNQGRRFNVVSRPRMTLSDTSKKPTSVPSDAETSQKSPPIPLMLFREYFSAMKGSWNSDRTYHYVPERRREKSQTTFNVSRLTREQIDDVMKSNGETVTLEPQDYVFTEGFRVTFLTRMESQGGLVESGTNLAFVPREVDESNASVKGDYFRDLGYEEKGPIAAKFSFNARRMQLTMTTYYTRVVSVDQIRLINPSVRLREIVNYKRPSVDDGPLVDPLLVGFGVELKGESKPLVEPLA